MNARGGGYGQQKAAAGPLGSQAIGGLQQKRHPHLELCPLGSGHQRHPFPLGQGALRTGGVREVGHQVPHHLAAGLPAAGEAIRGRRPHRRNPVVPAGPAGHPFGVGDVAIAQAGREQHRPELVTAKEDHDTAPGPTPWAQQQAPEAFGGADPLKQTHPVRHLVLNARGVRAGNQHQLEGHLRPRCHRAQGQFTVQALGQRAHPCGQFAGAIADQDDAGRVAPARGRRLGLSGGRLHAAEL